MLRFAITVVFVFFGAFSFAAGEDSCVLIETTSKKLIQAKSVTLMEGDWNIVTSDGVGITLNTADILSVKSKALPVPDEHIRKIEELEKSIVFKDKTIEKLKAEKSSAEVGWNNALAESESLKSKIAASATASPTPAPTPYQTPKTYATPVTSTKQPLQSAEVQYKQAIQNLPAEDPKSPDLLYASGEVINNQVVIINMGSKAWDKIKVKINSGLIDSGYYYEYPNILPPGESIGIGLMKFANSKNERFNPFQMKISSLRINVKIDGEYKAKGFDIGK